MDSLAAPTFELVPYQCEPGCCAPAGWVGHRCLICDSAVEYGGTVEAITSFAREHEESIHQRAYVLAREEGFLLLKLLALPFKDHPDWQEDWNV